MNKDNILIDAKKELNNIIASITFENSENKKDDVIAYFKFINSLNVLPNNESKEILESSVVIPESEGKMVDRIKEAVVREKDAHQEDADEDLNTYIFERKIRGGIILGLEDGYMVPEKLIRDMGLHHLDKVRVLKKFESRDNKHFGMKRNHYQFEIAESQGLELEGRVELRYCVVREDESGVYVDSSAGSEIRIDGEVKKKYINEYDVKKYNLEVGDIVDIAFASDENLRETIRIIHKEMNMMDTNWVERVSATKKSYKEKVEKLKIEKNYGILDKGKLEGKKLLVVGGVTRHPDFKTAIEYLGAEFLGSNGLEDKVRMESMIKSCDVMVISINECSHAGSTQAITFAKKHGIPFEVADRNGIQKVMMSFEKALEKKKPQEAVLV